MKVKSILPPTFQKVFMCTDPKVNEEIRKQSINTLNLYKNCSEAQISDRITQLEQEWDTERVLEVHSSLLLLFSSYMGIKSGKVWFILTGIVAAFMLQHALKGWCPALQFIRRYGVRTAKEIYEEKIALKLIRGDFNGECNNGEDALTKAEK